MSVTSSGSQPTRVLFGDVVRRAKRRTKDPLGEEIESYVGLEHLESADLAIRSYGDVSDGTTFTSVFEPGQVLFGKRRAYQRKVAIADFTGVCSGDIYVLETVGDRLLPELLPFLCLSEPFFEYVVRMSQGGLSPRVNWTALSKFTFNLPARVEQEGLLEVLEAERVRAETARAAAEASDEAETALLKTTFGTKYGSAPSGTNPRPLSELAEVRTGLAKGLRAGPTTMLAPYVRVANVKDGHLDLREVKEIVVERDRLERYRLCRGDVLMTEGGDLDKLGRGTVWEGQIEGCLHQNHVFAVRVDPSVLDPWYLAAVARSPYGRSYFLASAKRSSNLASINKGQVSAFEVPWVSPERQDQFVELYLELREVQEELRARAALNPHVLAMLSEAFR